MSTVVCSAFPNVVVVEHYKGMQTSRPVVWKMQGFSKGAADQQLH
jgi:hypothetical protein